MNTRNKLILAWALLAASGSLFAEDDWRFRLDIGGAGTECNGIHAGATAGALGCSAIPVSLNSRAADTAPAEEQDDPGVLKLADAAQPTELGSGSDAFWTMNDGAGLDYAQVTLSAVLHRATAEPANDLNPIAHDDETILVAMPAQAGDSLQALNW